MNNNRIENNEYIKKPYRQYKSTDVSSKKNIARALNTFATQYDFICTRYLLTEFDTKTDIVTFDFFLNVTELSLDARNKIVFNKSISDIHLQDYNIIIEELDNMYSSYKKIYIDNMKDIIQNSVDNKTIEKKDWTTDFFSTEYISQKLMYDNFKSYYFSSNKITDDNFSINKKLALLVKKIFTLLKNRIQFRYINLYNNIIDDKTSKNIVIPQYISLPRIEKEKIKYIKKLYWIYDEDFIQDIHNIQDKKNKYNSTLLNKYSQLEMQERICSEYPIKLLETDEGKYLYAIEVLILNEYEVLENDNKGLSPYDENNDIYSKYSHMQWTEDEAVDYINTYNNDNQHLTDLFKDYFDEYDMRPEEHPIDEMFIQEKDDEDYSDDFLKNELSINTQWNILYSKIISEIEGSDKNNRYYQIREMAMSIIDNYKLLDKNKVFTKTGRIRRNSKYCIEFKENLTKQLKDEKFIIYLKDFKNKSTIFHNKTSKEYIENLKTRFLNTLSVKIKREIINTIEEVFNIYQSIWIIQFKIMNDPLFSIQSIEYFDYHKLEYNKDFSIIHSINEEKNRQHLIELEKLNKERYKSYLLREQLKEDNINSSDDFDEDNPFA